MRLIARVAPLAVLLVAFVTATIVLLGPEPFRPASHPQILHPQEILIEPRDRGVLLAWWLVAAVLFGVVLLAAARGRLVASPDRLRHATTGRVVGLAAVVVAFLSILLDVDHGRLWPGIGVLGLLAGTVLTVITVLGWRSSPRMERIVTAVLLVLLLVVTIPAVIQTPAGVRDWGHFPFTADELAAPAAGLIPLVDFFPQYSTLLGLPLVPVLHLFAATPEAVILAWLLALQILTVGIAIALSVHAGGRRILPVAALVIVLPIIASTTRGYSVVTYFAGMPMRVLLPTVTIALAYWALGRSRTIDRRQAARLVGVGLAAGMAVLNNIDFGVPVVASVVLAELLIQQSWTFRLRTVAWTLVGIAAPFVLYGSVVASLGVRVDWSSMLVFQRLFGVEGYLQFGMQPFGLHVGFAALFVSASVIGALLLRSRRARPSTWFRRQGLLISLVGVWSLLCLPYFTGRSFTVTLISGHGFQAGFVLATLLPLARLGLRALPGTLPRDRAWLASSLALTAVAMSWLMGTIVLVRPAQAYISAMQWEQPLHFGELAAGAEDLDYALGNLEDPALVAALSAGRIDQLVTMPAMTSLITGVPSHSVVNNPEYFTASRAFSRIQCEQGWPAGTRFVVMSDAVAKGLREEESCLAVLDLDHAIEIGRLSALLRLVPVRTS